jgi:hypothetical protein
MRVVARALAKIQVTSITLAEDEATGQSRHDPSQRRSDLGFSDSGTRCDFAGHVADCVKPPMGIPVAFDSQSRSYRCEARVANARESITKRLP